jgi:sugar phosphate isomerase/epimerase
MTISDVGVFLATAGIPDPDAACAAVHQLGFRTIQFGKLPERYYSPEGGRLLTEMLQRNDLEAAALCMVYDGESYSDLDAVRRTVGFVPSGMVEGRVAYSLRVVDTAADLGVPLVTAHVGIIPSEPEDPSYQRVQRAVAAIADHAQKRGVKLALETGQETADELIGLIDRVDAPVWVNFDGANFVAYSTQDPLEALSLLYSRTLMVHIKDYLPPPKEGRFIQPCPLGQGAARIDETISFLMERGFAGPLILEQYDRVNPLQTLAESRTYILARLGR